jgi:penicillin-binding protein 1A
MLMSVVDHGTATGAKVLARPVAGKTGTSNNSKDTWFAGFSKDFVAVSWVGYDDGKPLGSGEAGGVTALPAWVSFMKAAHAGKPAGEFVRPEGLISLQIDKTTGKLPYADDTDTMEELFLEHTEPTEVADVPAAFDAGVADSNAEDASDPSKLTLPPLPDERR